VCGSRGRGDSSNKVRGILKDISHWRIELSLVLNEDWHFTKPLNVLATELSQPSTLSYLLGGAEKRYITYIRSSIFLPLKEHSEGKVIPQFTYLVGGRSRVRLLTLAPPHQ
jgi:hypothetical protein